MRDYLGFANSHIKAPRSKTTGPSMADEDLEAFMDEAKPVSMLALTTKIVAAYISKNAMPGTALPARASRSSGRA